MLQCKVELDDDGCPLGRITFTTAEDADHAIMVGLRYCKAAPYL